MATKSLNYTAAEINQRLGLAGTAVQPSALNNYYTKTEFDGKVIVDLSVRYTASYANLSAALTALNSDTTTDATAIKKAGVSIKFINSSTNKYEQWNLKASSWSTNTSDWALDVDGSIANGKLKLPFELEKPSNDTFVTKTSEIGHKGLPLSDYPIDNILPTDTSKHYANSDLTSGQRINSAGNVENNAAYVISDYVSLNNIASITVNSNKPDTISWIAFYNEDKQLLSNIVGDSGSTVTKNIVTPTDWGNAIYCRFCWYGNNGYYADFVYLQSAATKQEVEAVNSYAQQEIATINAYLNRLPVDESKHYANSDLTSGQRINAAGNIENSQTYRISDFVSLENIASISVRSVKPTTISWIAFYDENKQLLSNIVGESNDLTTLTVTPTTWGNAIYCRFCWYGNNGYYADFVNAEVLVTSKDLQPIEAQLANLELDSSITYANSDLTSGQRINAAGNIENNQTYRLSDYVSLINVKRVTINSVKQNTISWIAFYDENKILLSNLVADTGAARTTVAVTPETWDEAVYCRFCWPSDSSNYAKIDHDVVLAKTSDLSEIQSDVNDIGTEVAIIAGTIKSKYTISDLTSGQRINAAGNIENNQAYRLSDYVSLSHVQSVTIYSFKPITISWIAYYDAEKQLVSNVVGDDTTGSKTQTPTDWGEAAYCRFCWNNNNSWYALFEFDVEATSNKDFEECNMSIPDADKLANLRRTDIDLSTGNPSTAYKRLVLLHFADIHGDTKRFNRICDFYNVHKTQIDDVLLNGDIVGAVWADDITAMEANPDYNLFLKTLGNHDVNQYTGDSVLTDAYNRYFKNGISDWGVVQPENAEANGYMYYYKDYNDQNVRLIVLDCMHYDNTQNSWLIEVLADANTNGKHVMIAQHMQAVSYTNMSGFDCNYNSLRGDVGSYWYNSVTAVDNFINNGGVFICWLFGHVHSDRMGVFTDHPNQMYIIIGSAKCMSLWNECVREDGGYSQDLYDLVSIDTQSKHISIVRIGAKFDRLMRHKEFTVLDYNSRKVVTCY